MLFRIAVAYFMRRNTAYGNVVFYVLNHNGIRPYTDVIAYIDISDDFCSGANINIIAYFCRFFFISYLPSGQMCCILYV